MFVRKKTKPHGGSAYYQLVEARRIDGKPRQRVVMHLGEFPTVDDALEGLPRKASRLRRAGYSEAADELIAKRYALKGLREKGVA